MSDPRFLEDVRTHLAVLHKRRWWISTCVGASLLCAALYNYTTRPLYRATAQILIDRDAPNVLSTREVVGGDDGGSDYYQTQYELLRGRQLVERVIERLQLQTSAELQTGPLLTPWERLRRWLPAGSAVVVDRHGIPLSPAVDAFRSRLAIEPVGGSRLVNLRFSAYDPELASRAVNTIAQLYIQQSLEFRYDTSTEATDWLQARVEEQRRKVLAAEESLQRYREREGLAGTDMPQGMAEEKLSALNRALLDARSERMSKEVLHRQLRSLSAPQLASFPPVMASPLVQGLRTRLAELRDEEARLADTLGDRHPDLLRLRARVVALDGDLAAEIATIVRGIESEFEMARQRESNLAADLEAAKRGALSVNRKSIELAALRREVESSQQSLRELMSRTRETGLESQLRSTNLRIVEKADTPREPVFPRQTWNLQLAFFVGLAFGIGLAYVMERMDDTIRTPDDVTTGPMSLPFLGMIPEIPPTGPGVQAPLVLKEPRSAAAEAYRVLRTNLIFSSAQSKGRVIMVSSANPGEGKTTTVANLAAALAQNGARVLAVDADLRRPTMHDHFGLGHTPGLSDLIVGKCQVNDAIQGTRVSGLHVLACGYIPPNPAELLGSDNMRDLLAAQRHQFDWIFIDAPPILAMADAPVLCPIVDGLVMIVWAESSTRPALQRAVDQVHRVGGKLTGIVLNKVDLERNSYYYGQYYGEYYRKYYSEGVSSIADSAADAGTLPRQ